MDQSFLHISKLAEYFSCTVAIIDNKRYYIREVLYYNTAESCPDRMVEDFEEYSTDYEFFVVLHVKDDKGLNSTITMCVDHYDDAVKRITPWFPPSFYAVSRENTSFLFRLVMTNHYKRSACSETYQACLPSVGQPDYFSYDIRRLDCWTVPNKSLEDAVCECIETDQLIAINEEFAVSTYDRAFVLFYCESAIGKIEDDMTVTLHPKYYNHFRSRVAKIGKVNNNA